MCVSQTNHKDKIVKLRCKANGRVFKTNNQIFFEIFFSFCGALSYHISCIYSFLHILIAIETVHRIKRCCPFIIFMIEVYNSDISVYICI
ncbi:unnamed protein product [Brassica oleracea]|uniref:(rape) hypothetical protein n=1 Tax=Brassica napus TaxID=3708 RepID=A0A816KUV0_BRANA|nr:unnamed protein product [Brassica napus]